MSNGSGNFRTTHRQHFDIRTHGFRSDISFNALNDSVYNFGPGRPIFCAKRIRRHFARDHHKRKKKHEKSSVIREL